MPRRRIAPELMPVAHPLGQEASFFDQERFLYGNVSSDSVCVDDYLVNCHPAQSGTFSAEDVGLGDLDDNPEVFVAAIDGWDGVQALGLSVAQAVAHAKAFLDYLLREAAAEDLLVASPHPADDPNAGQESLW